MIRSLASPANLTRDDDEDFSPRRNLSRTSLEASVEAGDILWIDIVDPEDDEIEWLEQLLDLHPAVVADIERDDIRPTLMVYPHYLFLSLFEPNIKRNKVNGQEVHCLINENLFITVREANAEAVDDAYNRVLQNPDAWSRGAAYFLYLTTQFIIDAYYPLLDRISNQLNTLEEDIMNGTINGDARRTVYGIKQQLINLRQMIAPQREVLSGVVGESRVTSNADTRDLFRHLYERLLRVYDVIDGQRDLSSNVLDLLQSQASSRMVDAVNRLTIFSMIFLPLTFFTGLFELGFATTIDTIILPISGQVMFFIVLLCMILSATIMTWMFKRRGWI